MLSDDGGLTWQPTPVADLPAGLLQLDFVGNSGWGVVSNQLCDVPNATPAPCQRMTSSLWATPDGGAHWTRIFTP